MALLSTPMTHTPEPAQIARSTEITAYADAAQTARSASAALAARSVSQLQVDPAPLAGRCGDPAGSWLNMQWSGNVHWRLNDHSVPAYLASVSRITGTASAAGTASTPSTTSAAGVASAAGGSSAAGAPAAVGVPARSGIAVIVDTSARADALDVGLSIRSAAAAVASGHNDCELPADLTIDQRYDGDTDRRANVTPGGGCSQRDGHNVVSFGKLAPGLLAVTCVWWEGRKSDGRSVEADILVDDASGTFFLSQPPDCHARWDLQGILTHEFGHVFGLGHVPYTQHGALTMSDAIPECTTAYRGLGLGDYLTLRTRYAPA